MFKIDIVFLSFIFCLLPKILFSLPLGDGSSIEENEYYSWIYGSTLNLNSEQYPNYQERYIHHMFNIVRLDCKTYSDLYGLFSNVKTIVCDDSTVGQSPLIPLYHNPYICEAGRAHCHNLATVCDNQHHNSCDGTSASTRVNSYINPGCTYAGEILWYYSGMSYLVATDGWLCEYSANSGCNVGGHTRMIMRRVVGIGAYHPGYIGDFGGCSGYYKQYRNAIVSGIWKDRSSQIRFMALFYNTHVTGNVYGYLKIDNDEHAMTRDIGVANFGHYYVDISTSKNCQDYYFEFHADGNVYYYPRRGYLKLGTSCVEETAVNTTNHGDNPFICNPPCNHGYCEGTNLCACYSGWSGPSCDNYECIPSCSSHGSCIGGNLCSCNDGWLGTQCEIPTCTPPCSSHGECTNINVCTCDDGYIGNLCADIACYGVIYNSPAVCSGHGECTGPDSCVCEIPFHGEKCNHQYVIGVLCWNLPSENPSVCSGHGSCLKNNSCTCDFEYSGIDCGTPMTCYDIPFDDDNVCSGNGTCIRQDTCKCNKGYRGKTCLKIGSSSGLVVLGVFMGIIFSCCVIIIIVSAICFIGYKLMKNKEYNIFDNKQQYELEDEKLSTGMNYKPSKRVKPNRRFSKPTMPPRFNSRLPQRRNQNVPSKRPPQPRGRRGGGRGNFRQNSNRNNFNKPNIPAKRPPGRFQRGGSSNKVKMIKNYNAKRSDELSLRAGDIVTVIQKKPDGWYLGTLRSKRGFFPGNFSQRI